MRNLIVINLVTLWLLVVARGAVIPENEPLTDNSSICEECYSDNISICPLTIDIDESSIIHCQNAEKGACKIVKVGATKENNQIDFMCTIRNISEESAMNAGNNLGNNVDNNMDNNNAITNNDTGDLQLISIVQQTTEQPMLPLSERSTKDNAKVDKITTVQNDANFHIISVTMEPMLDVTVTAKEPLNEKPFEFVTSMPTFSSNEHNNAPQMAEHMVEYSATELDTVATATTTIATLAANTITASSESMDYQADEPHLTVATNTLENVATVKPTTEAAVSTTNAVKEATTLVPMANENTQELTTAAVVKDTTTETAMDMRKCFNCSSFGDAECISKPTKELHCKANNGIKNGCYTLLNVDSNLTTRGCIADLTEHGLTYCKLHTKLCAICYEHSCNKQILTNGSVPATTLNAALLLIVAVITFLKIA